MLETAAPTLFFALLGAGIFVRLVAKEKYRRERHLQFRLDEQVRKIEEEKELAKKAVEKAKADEAEKAKKEEAGEANVAEPLTLEPVGAGH